MIPLSAWALALLFAIPLLYLSLEIICGLRPLRECTDSGPEPSRIAILVPAHDEEGGIGATVVQLQVAAPGCDILVVADNCSDATADAARAAGAAVVERNEPDRRGKGYALAHGRSALAMAPPDIVIVVDADCRLAPGSSGRLAARSAALGAPVQAANLLTAPRDVSPLVAASNFAMLVKNLVRGRGLMRLGGGALLSGTGMAFPWALFTGLPLATGDTVEDINLALHLAREGVRVHLDDRALVTSAAAPIAASRAQRSRWEHGFLRTAAVKALPTIVGGLMRCSRHRLAIGLHLLVPPLVLLLLLALAALLALLAVAAITAYWAPAATLSASLGGLFATLALAWVLHGRDTLPLSAALRTPAYIVWKIPLYLALFTRRQTGWNRTDRGDGSA